VPEAIDKLVTRLASFKAGRDQGKLRQALGALARAAGDNDLNIYEHVVEAAAAGASHGEIVSCLQEEMGTGEPLVAA
jgi:methylmalonyl-CoA mutase N-terminal domain/subunit